MELTLLNASFAFSTVETQSIATLSLDLKLHCYYILSLNLQSIQLNSSFVSSLWEKGQTHSTHLTALHHVATFLD